MQIYESKHLTGKREKKREKIVHSYLDINMTQTQTYWGRVTASSGQTYMVWANLKILWGHVKVMFVKADCDLAISQIHQIPFSQ